MSRGTPLRVPFEFDEAIRRALNVKPPPKPTKRKRRRGTVKNQKRRRLAA